MPPIWVKAFSWLFIFFLVIPVTAIGDILANGQLLGIRAFGLDLNGEEAPLHWQLGVILVLILAGLTGFFIVWERRFAYSFGIFYCLTTFAITVLAHIQIGGLDTWKGSIIQYFLLTCFLVHLIRNRMRWVSQMSGPAPIVQPGD